MLSKFLGLAVCTLGTPSLTSAASHRSYKAPHKNQEDPCEMYGGSWHTRNSQGRHEW
jgi:hypothetical protein